MNKVGISFSSDFIEILLCSPLNVASLYLYNIIASRCPNPIRTIVRLNNINMCRVFVILALVTLLSLNFHFTHISRFSNVSITLNK